MHENMLQRRVFDGRIEAVRAFVRDHGSTAAASLAPWIASPIILGELLERQPAMVRYLRDEVRLRLTDREHWNTYWERELQYSSAGNRDTLRVALGDFGLATVATLDDYLRALARVAAMRGASTDSLVTELRARIIRFATRDGQ
jgi:hypothetical protein